MHARFICLTRDDVERILITFQSLRTIFLVHSLLLGWLGGKKESSLILCEFQKKTEYIFSRIFPSLSFSKL